MKTLIKKMKYAYAFVVFYLPTLAMAKLSERAQGVSGETSSVFSEFVFWVKVGGSGAFMVALFSMISKKKKNQPLDWEVWGMLGGAACVVALTLLGDTASSLSGTDTTVAPTASTSGF